MGARRLFFRYAANNVLILVLPLLVAVIYYSVSINALRDGIDSFAEAQLEQSIEVIDREFWELDKMVTRVGNDYEVNSYLSNNGDFSDIEFYNLRNLSEKLSPYVLGSPIVSHVFLYLNRSRTLISESSFGYYDDYYGTVVSVEGYDAWRWRVEFLSSIRRTDFIPSVRVTVYGGTSEAHLYRSNIGYGDYYLGSLVAVIAADELRGLLAQTPQQYGGWVHVSTAFGEPVATTDPGASLVLAQVLPRAERQSVTVQGERLRLYRMTSPVTGWRYTAALNETRVFADLRLVRSVALLLLGVGLALGLTTAYLFAFRSSKPWRKLFEVVETEAYVQSDGHVSAYQELESAIDVLANRNRRLRAEVGAAERMTRHYFFQNVLRGTYRSRLEFDREREEFDITFSRDTHYVIVARIKALNSVRGDDTYRNLRDQLTSAIDAGRTEQDALVPISFGDFVLIRGIDRRLDVHQDATEVIAGVRAEIGAGLRDDYCFGIGTAVSEPFLLTISFNQAMSAVTPLDATSPDLLCFYDDLVESTTVYSYPLDVEESLMRAVRAGNGDLVSQLLASVERENFENRRLTDADRDDLFVELKGTLLKLYNSFSDEDVRPGRSFEEWLAMAPGREKLHRYEELCLQLIERFDGRKRSHNSVLLAAIQEYIETNFSDPNLGIPSIAEAFQRSENYVSSFYKEQTGTRLSNALLKIRMERARELLAQQFEPIDHVAERCGYATAASFRRAFKRVYGVSPSEFRSRTDT